MGGTEERIDFSFLSVVLSLQTTSDFAAVFVFTVYIPANVSTNAATIINPILVLIYECLIYMTKIFWKCYTKG